MTSNWDDTVRELAEVVGIEPSYQDALGHHVETPIGSMRETLAAMGLPVDSHSATLETLERERSKHASVAPPWLVAVEGEAIEVDLHQPSADSAVWQITSEDQTTSAGSAAIVGNRSILPALQVGYHKARIHVGAQSADLTILVAPKKCWKPSVDCPAWGVSGPVYGLRSERGFGIGDFADLRDLADQAGRRGADFLGMSPVHALFGSDRSLISPYSPSSRLFIDPIYIDTRSVPGAEAIADTKRPVVADALVDYPSEWQRKRVILSAAWESFRAAGGSDSFEQFRADRGEALQLHATFEAMAEHAATRSRSPYSDMPPVDSPTVKAFRRDEADSVAFQAWLQWLAESQLQQASEAARSGGMAIGLIADLAVGAAPGGSEAWASPDRYLTGLSIGAPPDALAPHGQNWALRALDPIALARDGMPGLRALVSANMRHAGGLRMDHAFQLQRLFLIPDGAHSGEGAYLAYPKEAMLAVMRIESHRARCMVIGEDLGTSPPRFSEALSSSGIPGYRVMYFEREEGGGFRRPADYDPDTMAVLNTHDLATIRGWWAGLDIDMRLQCGVTDRDDAERAHSERDIDKRRLMKLLQDEGLVDAETLPSEPPTDALMRLTARCRSALVGIQLDDILGVLEQQNVPGVTTGVPNWRRRLPLTIEALAREGGPLDTLRQAMEAEGRGTHPETKIH